MTSEHIHGEHPTISESLQSQDLLKVSETLEKLRVSGKVSDIPVLIEMLHLVQNPEVRSKIVGLFSNLKEQATVPLLVEAIQNEKYAPELKELVSACWENGLDYSDYLPVFVGLLIESDFLVAFEAYTVITNMTIRIDQAKIDSELDRLEQAMPATTAEKRELMLDVVDFLPSIGL